MVVVEARQGRGCGEWKTVWPPAAVGLEGVTPSQPVTAPPLATLAVAWKTAAERVSSSSKMSLRWGLTILGRGPVGRHDVHEGHRVLVFVDLRAGSSPLTMRQKMQSSMGVVSVVVVMVIDLTLGR